MGTKSMSSRLVLAFVLFSFSFAEAKKIKIVTSFSILSALAEEILGDSAEISSLVKGNADPHHFNPSIRDIQRLKDADLILKNGLNFEPWMSGLIQSQGLSGKTLDLSKGIMPRKIPGSGISDPHAWLSAENALLYASNLREGLRNIPELDQANLDKRHSLLKEKITKVLHEIRGFKERMQKNNLQILCTHESLSYLGQELGVQVISVHSFNIHDFDNSKKINSIVSTAKEKKIAAAFAESSVPSPLFDRIVRENNLKRGDALYTESIQASGLFSGMLEHNVQAIIKALSY